MEKNHEKFGPWTDFYALGATLYNLLTHKKPPLPSDINDDHTEDKHLSLPMPSSLSKKTKDLVLWLMAPGRTARPQSVAEIKDRLNGQPVMASSTQTNEPVEETSIDKKPIIVEEKPTLVEKKKASIEKKGPRVVKIEEKPRKIFINKYLVYSLAFLLSGMLLGGLSYYGYHKFSSPPGETIEQAESETPNTVKNKSMTISLGECTYTWEVFMGQPNGKGTAVFDNGDIINGTFVHGTVSGDDIEYSFSNGDKFYGTIYNDQFQKGRYTVGEDGSYFEGTFENNEPATGHWYDENGNPID